MSATDRLDEIEARAKAPAQIAASVDGWLDKYTAELYDEALSASAADVPTLIAALRAVQRVLDAVDRPRVSSALIRDAIESALGGA